MAELSTPPEKERKRRARNRLIGLGAVALFTAVLAIIELWPFDLTPPPAPRQDPSLWHLLLEDRVTLGFVRLGLIAASLFALVSVPGLVWDKRWMKQFMGFGADDPGTVAELKSQVDVLTEERDEARAQRDEYRDRLETSEEGGESGDAEDEGRN